ncbi:MAG TPA: HEAT repeat domain-containing protein [Gemmata sp.]|nr:HEAT repeat domain-containing protein [Gemmata sp.]
MRAILLGMTLALLYIAGSRESGQAHPRQFGPKGQPLAPPLPGRVVMGAPVYHPPNATGAVAELLDEGVEPLFSLLVPHLEREMSARTSISREDRDVFTGVEAVRVTPLQMYQVSLPGWRFKIVEKPSENGEYRYLRFAWKKIGGTGIMIQFNSDEKSWFRYFAGANVKDRNPAHSLAAKLPTEWSVVTCDLFKDHGAITLIGLALSPFDGDAALFDHVLLGRTVEDLDHATHQALGRVKSTEGLKANERAPLWLQLTGTDANKAAAALRKFLATAPDQVGFIREHLTRVATKIEVEDVQKLIASLNADEFEIREEAMLALIKLGSAAIEPVREAARKTRDDEVRFRCQLVLRKLGDDPDFPGPTRAARLSRAIRILERAGNNESRKLLTEIAAKKISPELAADAQAALDRLAKR